MIGWISAFVISMFLFIGDTYAESDMSVVDVRRNIPLSDDEPVYKDFYINAGEDKGLKKNLVVTATRKIQIRDASGAQSIGDIDVPVGQLRILAVYGRIAVAREYKSLSREDFPMLEQTGIMGGDKIDLRGAFVDDAKNSSHKRKTSSTDPEPNQPEKAQVAAALLNTRKDPEPDPTSPANKDEIPNEMLKSAEASTQEVVK